MAIRGRLEHLKLFMVFRSILERRLSGVLTLQSAEPVRSGEGTGAIIKRAEIAHGYPVRTASNQRRDGLVYALVEEGLISSTEEVALREQAQQTRTPIDIMALQMGLVAPRRLQSIQERVARQILLEPFSWPDGLFQFEESLIRPDQNAQGIDLVDILLEAAARTLSADAATQFVLRYAGQNVSPTELLAHHAQRFDALFPAPNVRTRLTAPASFDALARQSSDRRRAAQEVAALILSGLARFQAEGAERPAFDSMAPPPEAESTRPSTGTIRRVSAPANVAGGHPPSVPPVAGPVVAVHRSIPPPAAPPPAGGTPPVRRADAARPPEAGTAAATRPRPAVEPAPPEPQAPPPPTAPTGRPAGDKPGPDEKILARIREAKERLAEIEKRSHYEVLGVPNTADADTLRTAFRNLAREFHADRYARYALDPADLGAVQRYFIAINRAAEVLSNPQTRQEYDAELALVARGQKVVGEGGGADIAKVFRAEKLVREGINLIRNGGFETARDRFTEALSATPDDPLGLAGLAYAEFMIAQARGGAQKALQTRTIEILTEITQGMGDGGREEPHYYLGRVYVLTGQPDRAAVALNKAIKINPHCAEAVSELRHLQRKPEKKEGLFGLRKKG